MAFDIQKAAISGPDMTGGGIAAHSANVSIRVLLVDTIPRDLATGEAAHADARNQNVRPGYERMLRAEPAHLASENRARYFIADRFSAIAGANGIQVELGTATMCTGAGLGAAAIFENVSA